MKTSPAFSGAPRALALLLFALFPAAQAARIQGVVKDQSGAPIAGAQAALVGRVGVLAQRLTDRAGRFEFDAGSGDKLQVIADGFETKTIALSSFQGGPADVVLAIAAQTDSIRVTGTSIDTPASQQGGGVSIVSTEEIRRRNEAQAVDLLRYLPGMVVEQGGQRGGLAALSIRGGDSKFNLVLLDGAPVNSFYYGGLFDFAQVPSDFLERIEVARGPQSAVYGSYANSGVVNFVTRSPQDAPQFDFTAEGGSLGERRFSVNASDLFHGFGIAGSVSRLDFTGPVPNSDYENTNAFLSLSRSWGRQSLTVHGNYDFNNTGEPGPYGSNPAGLFTGIDLISRSRNYFSDYMAHYQAEVTDRVRQEVFASFFLNNSPYTSPYGFSFNKDIRADAEERTTISVAPFYTLALGFVYEREEDKNTYIADASSRNFPLRRDQQGIYWENRFQFWNRLFLNAGIREEVFEQASIPAEATSPYYATRPFLPPRSYEKASPKVSAAYIFKEGTRIHSSFGTGIRPPGGSDLAFTNNPDLKPERTISVDAGVEQRFARDRVSIGATYFRNRYSDQIVSLGGNLAVLGFFQTGNLSRTKSDGAELTGEWRPARWLSVAGNYTHLDTAVLSLEGSQTLVQTDYTLGQQLPRRPKHSGSVVSTVQFRNWSANVTGYFRGETLDIEPNYGASAGFYRNPGYQNLGINLNYRAGHGLTVYGGLRNALDQRYEEVYGFPSAILNFVAGVKWSFSRGAR